MSQPREDGDLFDAYHERGRKALRCHRHHSRRAIARGRHAGGFAEPLSRAGYGGDFCQRGRWRKREMNWRNILTVYGKELRDMLRDRRTVISMIVIPTLVMP